MNKQTNIPPRQRIPTRVQHPRSAGASDAEKPQSSAVVAPTRIHLALSDRFTERGVAITADNLPVLNAFNEYLETERRSARRRFRGLLLVLAMLLAISVVAAFFVGRMLLGQFRGEIAQERQRTESIKQQLEAELSGTALEMQDKLAVRDRAMRHTYSALQSHVHGHTNTIAQISDGMSALELEIAMLESTIRELSQRLQSVPDQPRESDDATSDLEAQIAEDFMRLRLLAQAQQAEQRRSADDSSQNSEQAPGPRIDRSADDRRNAPSGVTIETPAGYNVPWRF